MRTIKTTKSELLSKIMANRVKHIADYKEAVADYKVLVMERAQKVTAEILKEANEIHDGEMKQLSAVTFHDLQPPKNHTKSYDQVIMMLEMSIETELEVRSDEFACYVMDDWEWKDDFVNTNRFYKSARGV